MAPPQTHETARNRWNTSIAPFGLGIVFLAIAAVTVYFRSFSNFAEYDDEGYLMIGLRSFLRGNALYDRVHSQYGPFYYLIEGGLYRMLHVQVTNDAVRCVMASIWVISALLCSWAVYRLTKSWVLTALGFTAAVRLMGFFSGSPGHPEEICLALLLGVLICACYLSDRASTWLGVLLGSLLAALALTKINIGIFAAGAISLALVRTMPSGKAKRTAFAFLAIASFCLPMAIMWPLWRQRWAELTVFLVLLSLGSAILVAGHTATERIVTPALASAGALGLLISSAVILAPILLRGTTLSAIVFVVFLQHAEYAKNWYIAFHVHSEAIPIASFALAIAWILWDRSRARGRAILALNVLKLLLSVAWLLELRMGDWPLVYNFTIPCAWLLLVPAKRDDSPTLPLGRVALCLLTVLSALYMLPVASAQVSFSVVLTIPMVCVFLDDIRVTLVHLPIFRKAAPSLAIAALTLLVSTDFYWALSSHRIYHRMESLSLPGAERIHVSRGQASTYRWMTSTLISSCESYYSMPGLFSLYFWTRTDPPTALTMSNWFGLLTNDQQQHIVDDLSRFQNLCVVYNRRLVEGWRRGQDLKASPLARYIHDNFVPVDRRQDYYILVRKGQLEPKREFDSGVVALPR